MKNQFDLSGILFLCARRWKLLFFNGIVAVGLAIVYSFFIAQKQFVSSVTFLPPFEENSILSMVYSGMLSPSSSSDIMPQHIKTIFESKSLRRSIINKFNYYEKYKLIKSKNKFELALKSLKKDLIISSEELGSLGMTQPISFTISSYHNSADTACKIISYAFALMDSTINEISIDRGRRNRMFVEQQLAHSKHILDSLQTKFKAFQTTNKVYDIPEQVQLALKNYGNLKAQKIANDLKIEFLKKDYNGNYPAVQTLKKENEVINAELDKLESVKKPNVIIGLENSIELMPEYLDFLRDVEVQNKLILIITQQLEEAKIKEARDVSSLKIVDYPFVPEYKIRPKRILLCVGVFSVYMLFVFTLLLFHYFYQSYLLKSSLFNEIINASKSK